MHFKNEFTAQWLQEEIQSNQKHNAPLNYQCNYQIFDTLTLDAIHQNVNGI